MSKPLTTAACGAWLFAVVAAFAGASAYAAPPSDTIPAVVRAAPDASDPEEVARIQGHLSRVERALRARDTSALSDALKRSRERNLDRLHVYWTAGRFPHNHDFADKRVPYFIDAHGTACAVADLVIASGHEALAQRVARTADNAYVRDLASDPELVRWASESGLTLDELAWIQPTYGPCWGADSKQCASHCIAPVPALLRWDGSQLQALGARPDTLDHGLVEGVQAISAVDENNVWGVSGRGVERWTGSAWERVYALTGLRGVWGTRDEVYVAGDTSGRLRKSASGTWQWTQLAAEPMYRTVAGSAGSVWFASEHGALHVVGDRVERVPIKEPARVWSVSAATAKDVWLSGSRDILHWDGARLAPVDQAGSSRPEIVGVFAPPGGAAWRFGVDGLDATRAAALSRWDGSSFVATPIPGEPVRSPIRALWASGANSAWAAAGPELLRWDGATWSRLPDQRYPVLPQPRRPFAPVGIDPIVPAKWNVSTISGVNDEAIWFLPAPEEKWCRVMEEEPDCAASRAEEMRSCLAAHANDPPLTDGPAIASSTTFIWWKDLRVVGASIAAAVIASIAVLRRRKR
jgi:hypothetical protein